MSQKQAVKAVVQKIKCYDTYLVRIESFPLSLAFVLTGNSTITLTSRSGKLAQ
jgi:hypothetical protein